MALRPNTLQVLSSTEIEIGFNKKLSGLITSDNFEISTSVGLEDNIKILNVLILSKSIILTTNPQVPGTLYLLSLKDSDLISFSADDGDRLVNDDTARIIYFVGFDGINPVRDSIFLNVPKTYNLDGSNIRNILSSQSEELYQLEKHIGEALSDNYISVRVEDEIRRRGPSAKDRLANENAFMIESISRFPSGQNLRFDEISFDSTSKIPSQKLVSKFPISLQQVLHSEEFLFSNLEQKLSGFVLNLEKNNILKLESLKFIKQSNFECDSVELEYNIDKLSYSIFDNKYDPLRSYSHKSLKSNQVLISELFDLNQINPGDTIKVSYLYKDLSKKINEDSVVVYDIKSSTSEYVPQQSTRFFLKNAPITKVNGKAGEIGDVSFFGDGSAFSYEVSYYASRIPSNIGEYSVNYETGEVLLYGNKDTFGTSDKIYFAEYFYKKVYQKNIDYYLDNGDFVATSTRELSGSEAKITFNYQQQFVDGVDYKSEIHSEVIGEQVGGNVISTFNLKVKNAPITKVFSVYNQTTGETYQPVSWYKNEVIFSAINPPRISASKGTVAEFDRIQSEKLNPSSRFLNSIFKFKVIGNSSLNNIQIFPPIPSNIIDSSVSSYYLKDLNGEIQNMNIRFFGSEDLDENIGSFALTSTSDLPDLNKEYIIGINCLTIKLENANILNAKETEIGSFIQSSIILNDKIFLNEKFFYKNNDVYLSTKSRLELNNFDVSTISVGWLNKPGDYTISYKDGVIYLATDHSYDKKLGYTSYSYAKILHTKSNIITVDGIYRKKIQSDLLPTLTFEKYKVNNGIELQDLNPSIELPDGSTINVNGSDIEVGVVNEDYILYTKISPTAFYGIYKLDDLFGNKSSNYSFRKIPASPSDLRKNIEFGGKNLYSSEYRLSDKFIDLKKYKVFKAKNNSGFNFQIPLEYFGSIFSIKNITLDVSISDQTLDCLKFNTEIYNVEESGSTSTIQIDPDLSINVLSDYIKDSSNRKFTISSYNSTSGELEVNNIIDGIDYISPEVGTSKIVKDISITDYFNYKLISIPSDCMVRDGDSIEISYLLTYTPAPYSRLATSYSSGAIFYDITETIDNLAISYEYGDNEINWQINNSISENEIYYVTYRYGALRDSLKNNFGILTKMPFFVNFSLNTDRELYRKALQGVMESFSRGPVKSSFENLIEKFTEQTPDITESFFGSWILGRDYLNHDGIHYSGELEFESGKFDSGILINGNTIVNAPSKSSINLDEGTFSCWIRNDWHGIENDADVLFDFSKMSKINFHLRLDSNIFKDQDFNIFLSEDRYGVTDWTGDRVSIYNYQMVDDNLLIGPYGITKYNERLNGSKWSRHSFLISATPVSGVAALPDFFKIDPGTLAARLTTFGTHSLMGGSTTSSRGFSGGGLEVFLNYYCSPFSISIGDSNKAIMMLGVMSPIKNTSTGRVYVLNVDSVESKDIANYDGPFIIKNCNCVQYSDIDNLLLFNKKDLFFAKIELDSPIDISYLKNEFQIYMDNISGCKFITNDGRIYSIYSFIDSSGVKTNKIPTDGLISGFITSKLPENKGFITSQGSYQINNSNPVGTGIITVPSVTIPRDEFNSELVYGTSGLPLLIDYTNQPIEIIINRLPQENKVEFKVSNFNFNMLYSDLLNIDNYNQIFEILNLNSWFALDSGYGSQIDGMNNLNNNIFIGSLDPLAMSTINLYNMSYSIQESISIDNIYIGSKNINPKSLKFSLNRFKDDVVGEPKEVDDEKAIYIWLDENYIVDNNNVGSWKVKFNIPNQSFIPLDIDGYTTNYNFIEFKDYIEGTISTECGFSYAKAIKESVLNSSDYLNKKYRFCGQSKLEDSGWKMIGDYGTELVNTIIGGTEHNSNKWIKYGNFETELISSIYRISNIENESYLYLPNNFVDNLSLNVSFKVIDYDESIIGSNSGSFSGTVSGNLIGLNIAEIFDGDRGIKVSLAANSTSKYLVILDLVSNSILDIILFDWFNLSFNELNITLKREYDVFTISHLDNILSRIKYSNLEVYNTSCDNIIEPGIFIRLNDKKLTSTDFIDIYNQVSLDIDYIELLLFNSELTSSIENSDFLSIQKNKIDFKMYNNSDGYLDSYGYYEDGSDIDIITFVADCDKYILDSGESESKNRLSIYKDYNGYLNFRIFDSMYKDGSYTISSSVKHFMPGEQHHIAASWRLNSPYQMDEMRLFIDGKEVPSLYKFGGDISPWRDSKVGDVAKSVIQDFSQTKINYSTSLSDGQILAGENYIISESANFTEDDIGRSIIISNGGLASELNGQAFIIGSISGNSAKLLDIDTLEPKTFSTSSNNVEFFRPPYINKGDLSIDFSTSKFEIYRVDCSGSQKEIGGVLYKVNGEKIEVIKNNVVNPKYRINVENGVIEFLEKNKECNWIQSVLISDLDIWIELFGLNKLNIVEKISYSSSRNIENVYRNDLTGFITNLPEPINPSTASIRRILLDATIPDGAISDSIFEFEINKEILVSSNFNDINKGRLISVKFDSDNINYCNDGYSSENILEIEGEDLSGSVTESVFINENKIYNLNTFFKKISKISGRFNIVDVDMEPLNISIIETSKITESDNSGECAEIFRYSNGTFFITKNGSNGSVNYNLPEGIYLFEYPSFLNISLNNIGDRIFFGTDIKGRYPLIGLLDEVKIITEISGDIRDYQSSSVYNRNITEDFLSNKKPCVDAQTIFLSHFDDPFEIQMRRLRNKIFLNENDNFKFKLNKNDLENLSKYLNKKESFVSYMINSGFKKEIAEETYVETHMADGGPLFNEVIDSNNYELIAGHESVNNKFGTSGKFYGSESLSEFSQTLFGNINTIEFWISPLLSTDTDLDKRVIFNTTNVKKILVTPTTSNLISLPYAAEKIISITLPEKKDSSIYQTRVYDDISRSKISGRLEGGTGVLNDFSAGHSLKSGGRVIVLKNHLLSKTPVLVSYIEKNRVESSIQMYIENDLINFKIKNGDNSYLVSKEIIWNSNSWHKVAASWKVNTGDDYIKLSVDGSTNSDSKYFGSITISEKIDNIYIGSNYDGSKSSLSRIDNFRISNIDRLKVIDLNGNYFDFNYSQNINTASPVIKDEYTTYINDFDLFINNKNFITLSDSKFGIYNFDIDVNDDFGKINSAEIEDLISYLLNKIKPSHTNLLVKFKRKGC